MEFIAIVVAMSILIQLGARNSTVTVRGDNKSSLAWVLTERFKGLRSQRAAVVYVALGVRFDLVVGEACHIAGTDNDICDQLSRGVCPSDLGFSVKDSLSVTNDSIVFRLMQLCDPVQEMVNEGDLIELWSQTNSLISSLE